MKVVALLSGGLDSTVLLAWLKSQGHEVHGVSVLYGQRHFRELQAVDRICRHYKITSRMVKLPGLVGVMKGSALTDRQVNVPEGHYQAESMKATVVPNRNMLLVSVAGAWAISLGAEGVAYAAHSGDHAIYPDCRPEFISALSETLAVCSEPGLQLLTPFYNKTKADLVKIGTELKAPLNMTYSCYCGAILHCGRCGTCTERREAFTLAGVEDPTEYAVAQEPEPSDDDEDEV